MALTTNSRNSSVMEKTKAHVMSTDALTHAYTYRR